eukprot:CAMPEP_0202469716 /NCGR_PEP_ID=MMETSP1360-20130828/79313_1 /ASSEMBLY_ACC=CAM_ASM_000848 /TAXON_ID=515479 /ORGANISM="Licmophora paradoxa, Strain CCMP2313" /LENGTH=140 /DNA_ID=CAMNT_0049095143 /DNA_START=103 /DNA_END=522 /DNA_ORIENTATION=+
MISLGVTRLEKWVLKTLHGWNPQMGLLLLQQQTTHQFRDQERQQEAASDRYSYKGRLRVASAMACVSLAKRVEQTMAEVRLPFLCLLAKEDVVVDNSGVDLLMQNSPSKDKTLKEYNALHSLMCETEPLRGQIEEDILKW